jgi:hypothetical protein
VSRPWSAWTDLSNPGEALASITVVQRAPQRIHVLAVTESGRVFSCERIGDFSGPWSAWRAVGDSLIAAPGCKIAATARDTGKVDVFVFGTDYSLYTAAWESGRDAPLAYRGWSQIGSNFTPGTQISCIGRAPEYLDVFAVSGSGNSIWTRSYADGKGWGSWQPVP